MKIQWVDATRGYYFIHPTKKIKNNALWVGPFQSYDKLQNAVFSEFGKGAEMQNYDPVQEYEKSLNEVLQEIAKEQKAKQEARAKANNKIVNDVLAFMNR